MTQSTIYFGVLSLAPSYRFHLLQDETGGDNSVQGIRRSLKYPNEIVQHYARKLGRGGPVTFDDQLHCGNDRLSSLYRGLLSTKLL
jgi:hypothetical protein